MRMERIDRSTCTSLIILLGYYSSSSFLCEGFSHFLRQQYSLTSSSLCFRPTAKAIQRSSNLSTIRQMATPSTRKVDDKTFLDDDNHDSKEGDVIDLNSFLDDNFDNNDYDEENTSSFYDVESPFDYEGSDEDFDSDHRDDVYYDSVSEAYESEGNEKDYYERDTDLILTEREDRLFENIVEVEKCILVGVEDVNKMRRYNYKNADQLDLDIGTLTTTNVQQNAEIKDLYFTLDESLTEMRELIKTAGLSLQGEITQRLNEPNPKTYIGTGKMKEIKDLSEKTDACTIIFDAELTPRQQKALENFFNSQLLQNDFLGNEGEIKVLDRTALILDIFSQHAKTREGKLQVDLALHEYRKPRLTKMWTHLERQSGAGGVGLRGPGESQLEIDRRLIRDRIIVLQKKIDRIQKRRELHRKGRRTKGNLPILALVGYTNSGKSTLLNFLTRAGVLSENILFATLDPTTRKVKLPGYKTHPEVLLTDTVGFIQSLPTMLIAAFRATLEEVSEADLLIHVVDITNPQWRKQEQSVIDTLEEIGGGTKRMVRVFNKIDLIESNEDRESLKYEALDMEQMSVAVSALTGEGMEDFVSVVEDALSGMLIPVELLIPYSKGEDLNKIHEVGVVEVIDYREEGTYVQAKLPEALANRLRPYDVNAASTTYSSSTDDNDSNSSGAGEEEEIDWAALSKGRHPKKKKLDAEL